MEAPCCYEQVCSSCVLTWMTQEKRPSCPVCTVIWSVFDMDRIFGRAGKPVVESFTKSLIEAAVPGMTGQIGVYKKSRAAIARYVELEGNVKRAKELLMRCSEKKMNDLGMLMGTLIPPAVAVPTLKRSMTDCPLDHLRNVNDHMQKSLEVYCGILPEMCAAYHVLCSRNLIDRKLYGRAVSVLWLEHDVLEMLCQAIPAYLDAPDDAEVFGKLLEIVYLVKVAPNTITQVRWGLFTETVEDIHMARFGKVDFSANVAAASNNPTTEAACTSCGLERDSVQWIRQVTSHCPRCKKMPGTLFFYFQLKYSAVDAKTCGEHAAELYEPPAPPSEKVTSTVDMIELMQKESIAAIRSLNVRIRTYKEEMESILMARDINRQQFYMVDSPSPSHVQKPFFEMIRCTAECPGVVDLGRESETSSCCSVCDVEHCRDCWKVGGSGHICLDTDLQNVRAIKASSKQCPVCRTCIERTGGCPIMYCTQCRTGFNYDTGERIEGLVDNPHFYDELFSEQEQQTTTFYPTEGIASTDLAGIEQFNGYTADIAFRTLESDDIVHRTISRSVRIILDTPLVSLTLTRLRTLYMLVMEQILKYVCGDTALQSVIKTFRLIHRIESYLRKTDSLISFVMCIKSRVELLRVIDDAVELDREHNLQLLHAECASVITSLSVL